jgi:hypothetical protein
MDQIREVLCYHHYAYCTEQTYCQSILRYIYYFGGKTHPNLLGAQDVEKFLSHLVTEGKVSAPLRNSLWTPWFFFIGKSSINHWTENCTDSQ